jgi:hypothetical protein
LGHANRPWFHHAIGLDAQSRRLCLSSARRCESDTYTNGVPECYTYSDSYGNSYGNSNPHCDGINDTNTETYTHSEGYTVAETASYAAAAAIARCWQQLVIRCGPG